MSTDKLELNVRTAVRDRYSKIAEAFEPGTQYKLKLIYTAKDENFYEQYSSTITADDVDKFGFEIPLEHVDKSGWFTCSLWFELMTPIDDVGEQATAIADGIGAPCQPIIIRGTYLEIKG